MHRAPKLRDQRRCGKMIRPLLADKHFTSCFATGHRHDRRKNQFAALACTGDTVAPAIRNILPRKTPRPFLAAASPSISGRARRRVDFWLLMRLDHLDIESLASSAAATRVWSTGHRFNAQVMFQPHDNCLFLRRIPDVDLRSDIPVCL